MKHYILLFEECCFYEIVLVCYFLKATGQEQAFCSQDGRSITCMEGFRVEADMAVADVDAAHMNSLIIPGGMVDHITWSQVLPLLRRLNEDGKLTAGICAGVSVLEKAGILNGRSSVLSVDEDIVVDGSVITARPNAYVDFAIEVGKALDLFDGEADIRETVDFYKYHKRAGES